MELDARFAQIVCMCRDFSEYYDLPLIVWKYAWLFEMPVLDNRLCLMGFSVKMIRSRFSAE